MIPPESLPPIVVRVVGDPAPKGSSRAMLVGGRAVNVPSGSKVNERKLKGWKGAVVEAYTDGEGEPRRFHAGAVGIGVVFCMPMRRADLDKAGRPKTKAPVLVVVKPDTDKLVRSTLDALTAAAAWKDDSQVAICLAAKLYVPPGRPLGATITIANLSGMESIRGVIRCFEDDISLAYTSLELVLANNAAEDAATRQRLADERAAAKKTRKLDRITRGGRKPLLPEVPPFPPPPAPDDPGGAHDRAVDFGPDDDFGVAP